MRSRAHSHPSSAHGRCAGRFGPDELALAEELAGRVALVVAKERRYDREHGISHGLQASLLATKVPVVAGVEVAVR